MDPLSDVLALLRPRSAMLRGLDLGGRWALAFPAAEGLRCYAILSGACWLDLRDGAPAVALGAGDCFLLPGGGPFRLASDLAVEPTDAKTILLTAPVGGVATLGGGGDCFGVGGYFQFAGDHADLLLKMLPPVVHIRGEAEKAVLRGRLEQLREEMSAPRPGGRLIIEHLAQMLLVQALRLHMTAPSTEGVGWLFALADRQMSGAIGAMHADPARRWTLSSLAAVAGLSRSSFAARFKARVGTSPMDYLTRWRMLLATDRLANSGDPIAVIAPSLGYDSESAFNTAFKRVMKCSPRRYGRGSSSTTADLAA